MELATLLEAIRFLQDETGSVGEAAGPRDEFSPCRRTARSDECVLVRVLRLTAKEHHGDKNRE